MKAPKPIENLMRENCPAGRLFSASNCYAAMNARHKLCKIENRLRRIARRLTELNADKTLEIMVAKKNKRDPNLGDIYATIHRLENRARELAA